MAKIILFVKNPYIFVLFGCRLASWGHYWHFTMLLETCYFIAFSTITYQFEWVKFLFLSFYFFSLFDFLSPKFRFFPFV